MFFRELESKEGLRYKVEILNVEINYIMVRKKLAPVHPGKILREELLIPLNISPQELVQKIKVPKEQIK